MYVYATLVIITTPGYIFSIACRYYRIYMSFPPVNFHILYAQKVQIFFSTALKLNKLGFMAKLMSTGHYL